MYLKTWPYNSEEVGAPLLHKSNLLTVSTVNNSDVMFDPLPWPHFLSSICSFTSADFDIKLTGIEENWINIDWYFKAFLTGRIYVMRSFQQSNSWLKSVTVCGGYYYSLSLFTISCHFSLLRHGHRTVWDINNLLTIKHVLIPCWANNEIYNCVNFGDYGSKNVS